MRIVVLTKPVPDPASGGERLGPDGRLDRANSPAVVNGNDEYVLEKALKLIEAAGEGEVILLTMAPATAPETMRKALAMGATQRRPRDGPRDRGLRHGRDDADPRGGAQDARVRPRLRRRRHVRRTSRRRRARGRRADRSAVPVLRRDDRARRGRAHRAGPADHGRRLRCPRGADAGPHLRARRRSASRATHRSRGSWRRARRRSRRCRSADLGIEPGDGRAGRCDHEGRRFAAARAARRRRRSCARRPTRRRARSWHLLAERRLI